ncbi:MAG TPA: GUN4 domain-containing protein [Nostocaceae cyanobacterium]|nr:GUN4 domain-containing protein [Nostocaceae cyanobacterium]
MQKINYCNPNSPMQIDYSKLENLLKNKCWKEADQETFAILLKASDRKHKFLSLFVNLPQEVLQTIDNLWFNYSYGHFGFSVQKQIWYNLGGYRNSNSDSVWNFTASVGWVLQYSWKSYSQLNFDTNFKRGFFPLLVYRYEATNDNGLSDYYFSPDILLAILSSPSL